MRFGISSTSAGLVIRAKEVELLSMRGTTLISRVRVPIEGGEESHLIQAIQRAVADTSLETKKLAVSIPSHDILFRYFTIPNTPKAEWDSAVQFEARRYIPFKTDSLVWDYRVTPSSAPGQLEVIFAAIPRDNFSKLQKLLTTAGVQPTLIESSSLSLARLIEPSKDKTSREFVCLVDIEQDAAHLAIVKDRIPYLTRDIGLLQSPDLPSPGQSEAPPLAEFSVPGPGAGEGGPIQADAEPAAEAIEPQAERLLSELSVSMDFFVREHPATTISRIVLCGDEALIGPWCRGLSEQLHCPVALGTALIARRVQGGIPLSFASAVGLVQARRTSDGPALDFLKRSAVAKAPESLSKLSVGAAVALLKTPRVMMSAGAAAGLLLALWVAGTLMVAGERRQMDHAIQLRPDVGWGLSQMTGLELEPIRNHASVKLGLLKQIMGQRLSVAGKLDALARALSDGMWLTSLAFEHDMRADGARPVRLTVKGGCFLGEPGQELSAIQQFEAQMRQDETFFKGFTTARLGQVNAKITRRHGQEYVYRTFQLNCDSES